MSGRLVALPKSSRRVDEARELCVVLACHELVLAMPARWIERLVLPHEVSLIAHDPGQSAEARARSWQPVLVGEKRFAGCNLGTLLGMEPVDAAWVLLEVPHRGAKVPVAMQSGACLVVQELAAGVALPAGAFRARVGAVAAAFPTALVKRRGDVAEVGLWIDPARLWADVELDSAAKWLADEGTRG